MLLNPKAEVLFDSSKVNYSPELVELLSYADKVEAVVVSMKMFTLPFVTYYTMPHTDVMESLHRDLCGNYASFLLFHTNAKLHNFSWRTIVKGEAEVSGLKASLYYDSGQTQTYIREFLPKKFREILGNVPRD